MSDRNPPPGATTVVAAQAGHGATAGGGAERLEGRMGVAQLVFTVLAFNGPLAGVAGYLAFVIFFNGVGAPLMALAGGLIVLLFAVGFTTMSRYLPNPGAFYSYITAGLGRVVGLGAALLAIVTYLLVLIGVYAFFGIVADALVSGTLGGPAIAWYWYAIVALAACAFLGYRNIELSAKVLLIALSIEIVIVLVFNAAVLIDGGPQGRSLTPFTWEAATSNNVGISLLFAASLFLGFEATAIFREEAKNPDKTVPRATYVAILAVVTLYVLTLWAMITAFGVDEAAQTAQADPAAMFTTAMSDYVGQVSVDIVAVLLVSSVFAALLSIGNVVSRYLYSLGADGVLPRPLGRAHPRFASPHLASNAASVLVLLAFVPFVLADADPALLYGRLAGVGGFGVIVLELLTTFAVIAFFRKEEYRGKATVWHTVIAPVLAAVGLGGVVLLALVNFSTLTGSSGSLAVLLQVLIWGSLVLGMALAVVYRAKRPAVYERIGRHDV